MKVTTMTGRLLLAGPLLAALCGHAAAQTSTSFKVTDHAINAGGHPQGASRPASASFRISPDALGDAAVRGMLSSASYRAGGGFVLCYAPPGEALGLGFLADGQTMSWLHEPASMAYNVYSSPLSSLPGEYGGCAESRVTTNSWIDPSTPTPGGGRFYLVTGVNRLREEGTKGRTSSGAERSNPSPCP
jgi:hypothetical protein